jgi:hypothetical protein
LQKLINRLDQLSEQFEELRAALRQTVDVVSVSPQLALVSSRKVLEYVIHDVYERRIKEPPGTRPLENLLDRLRKDGFLPELLYANAASIRMLGNIGAHNWKERVTTVQAYHCLSQLMPVLEWYFEAERPDAGVRLDLPHEVRPTRTELEPKRSELADESRVAVVPKGLRAFDANDSDFFLQLLPGPRDKNGLPESVRFWKHRVESTADPDFTVGVMYGPSGCGKTSLMKAGLLPRLSKNIICRYLEAARDDTEYRLLKGLREKFTNLPADLNLTQIFLTLRQRHGLAGDQKLLLVLDQFEQWLHSHSTEQETDLAEALRQCDGHHVQCVLMVRDDCWMALTRFMSDLHIELVQGQNVAPVDLFDQMHARKVLAEFGRAFGRLPADVEALTRDQETFLDQAIEELSQDRRVISVRLALFAEMFKGRPWTAATLRDVGGTEGVGVAFLEATFRSSQASPKHRLHQKAAHAVLQALLPETGTDIRGQMRSRQALLDASGYAARPRDFDELIHILDNELRLITPTEAEGVAGVEWPASGDEAGRSLARALGPAFPAPRHHQLTHDYLVH